MLHCFTLLRCYSAMLLLRYVATFLRCYVATLLRCYFASYVASLLWCNVATPLILMSGILFCRGSAPGTCGGILKFSQILRANTVLMELHWHRWLKIELKFYHKGKIISEMITKSQCLPVQQLCVQPCSKHVLPF